MIRAALARHSGGRKRPSVRDESQEAGAAADSAGTPKGHREEPRRTTPPRTPPGANAAAAVPGDGAGRDGRGAPTAAACAHIRAAGLQGAPRAPRAPSRLRSPSGSRGARAQPAPPRARSPSPQRPPPPRGGPEASVPQGARLRRGRWDAAGRDGTARPGLTRLCRHGPGGRGHAEEGWPRARGASPLRSPRRRRRHLGRPRSSLRLRRPRGSNRTWPRARPRGTGHAPWSRAPDRNRPRLLALIPPQSH